MKAKLEVIEDDAMFRESVRTISERVLSVLSCNGDVTKQMQRKQKFIHELRNSAVAIETKAANAQHYEVPTGFFEIVLGPRLKYSSGLWEKNLSTGIAELQPSEDAMLELYCKRAKLSDGMEVLDLGCGWGSLSLFILEKFPNCKVLSISNSATQREAILAKAQKLGYANRIDVKTADANHFSPPDGRLFDRVMSIEMLEHMKNYNLLFARIASWLKPGGYLFDQILCHTKYAYPFVAGKNDWMSDNFFTGGTMPSDDLFLYFQKDLVLEEQWRVNGVHYEKTLNAWLLKMDANLDAVKNVFIESYGATELDKQIINWRRFFMYCAETFGFNGGNEWIVAHHLFLKR